VGTEAAGAVSRVVPAHDYAPVVPKGRTEAFSDGAMWASLHLKA
jgi:hypothetical protein